MYRESDRLIIKGKVWNLFQSRIVVTDYDNSFCLYDLAAKGHRSWETSIESQIIFTIGFIKDTSLYINDGSSSSYVLNVLNGQIEKKLNLSVNDSLGDLGLIGIMRDGKYCVGCVQLNEPEKIIWSVSPNPFFEVIDSNYLLGFPKPGEYGKNSSIFGRYSVDTGALLWHFDVTEPGRYREWYPEGPEHPGEVRKFIGVWEGMLLVALSGYTIVALDVETGRVLHKWRDIPGFEPGWMPSAIPKPERMVLDAAGGKLVALWSRYFWEIDLRSGDIQMHDLSADFGTPRDLVRYLVQGGSNPALLGDKHLIAFAERYHSARDGSDAEIIAFNRQTLQIDWRHTFPLGAGVQFGVNDPVIAGNRLYALDISGTLHIFERTE